MNEQGIKNINANHERMVNRIRELERQLVAADKRYVKDMRQATIGLNEAKRLLRECRADVGIRDVRIGCDDDELHDRIRELEAENEFLLQHLEKPEAKIRELERKLFRQNQLDKAREQMLIKNQKNLAEKERLLRERDHVIGELRCRVVDLEFERGRRKQQLAYKEDLLERLRKRDPVNDNPHPA